MRLALVLSRVSEFGYWRGPRVWIVALVPALGFVQRMRRSTLKPSEHRPIVPAVAAPRLPPRPSRRRRGHIKRRRRCRCVAGCFASHVGVKPPLATTTLPLPSFGRASRRTPAVPGRAGGRTPPRRGSAFSTNRTGPRTPGAWGRRRIAAGQTAVHATPGLPRI